MGLSSKSSGSQTAVLTTQHTLATITDAGVYVLNVDTSLLQNGEDLELIISTKTRSGDASTEAYSALYKHVQGQPQKFSIPVPVIEEAIFTLEQNGGTGRAFPWNILQLDS